MEKTMHSHTIELPDHISNYVNKSLDGHLEQFGDYVVRLIEEERGRQKAVVELQSILSDPKANTPSCLSMADIKQKAMIRVQSNEV